MSLTLLALSRLVGVPLEPIVELLLVSVQASLASTKAVPLLCSCQPLLHVTLMQILSDDFMILEKYNFERCDLKKLD